MWFDASIFYFVEMAQLAVSVIIIIISLDTPPHLALEVMIDSSIL